MPQQLDVVARAQGALHLDGPMAVVRGLGVEIVRAAADKIVSDGRIAYHHTISDW
jgi:hypothetical protein